MPCMVMPLINLLLAYNANVPNSGFEFFYIVKEKLFYKNQFKINQHYFLVFRSEQTLMVSLPCFPSACMPPLSELKLKELQAVRFCL